MHLAELWRYPVKSMAAESLTRAEIRADGIVGDRVVHVRGAHGRVVTARTRPRLLGHRATLGSDGEPLVDGRPWRAPEVAQDVVAAVGPGARLVRDDGLERFDVLPLLVATDGAIRVLGADRRRLGFAAALYHDHVPPRFPRARRRRAPPDPTGVRRAPRAQLLCRDPRRRRGGRSGRARRVRRWPCDTSSWSTRTLLNASRC